MSNNISILSTEEEKQIWFEVFPEFINYLKKHILDTKYFKIESESECYCNIVSYHTYTRFYQEYGTKICPSIEITIGDFAKNFARNSFDDYTIRIEFNFHRRVIVNESTFWGMKEKEEVILDGDYFYMLHLKPPNVTDDSIKGFTFEYRELKESYINKYIERVIKKYKNSDSWIETYYGFDFFLFLSNLQDTIEKFYFEKIKNENINRKDKLEADKKSILLDLDKDNNGEVDLVDAESFNKLLTKNQQSIIEIDKNYIQKFVKISMYLKLKKSNTQKIFESIKDTKNDAELNELMHLLNNQIHTYEMLVFHSISMVTSLVDSELITFYEIYECFDQLGVFNSNWENEVSNKLTDIGEGLRDLMYSIYHMENKIVRSIDNLTYVTQESFSRLNHSVNNQLSSIDSSIKFNNLLSSIQAYQMYKINQNT